MCYIKEVSRDKLEAPSRAEYMRNWRALKKRRASVGERAAFERGAAALREAGIMAFRKIGPAELSGYTAVEVMSMLRLLP